MYKLHTFLLCISAFFFVNTNLHGSSLRKYERNFIYDSNANNNLIQDFIRHKQINYVYDELSQTSDHSNTYFLNHTQNEPASLSQDAPLKSFPLSQLTYDDQDHLHTSQTISHIYDTSGASLQIYLSSTRPGSAGRASFDDIANNGVTNDLAVGGVRSKGKLRNAKIDDVGAGYGGHKVVDRLAMEAQGALSQANRILESGNILGRQTTWGRIYARVKGRGSWFEKMARRNALHQVAEARLLNNRYVLEAQRKGFIVKFNQGSILGIRNKKGNLLRPDIQIGLPNGKWGVIDWTTPGSASKINNYEHKLSPYLINITMQ